MNRRVAAALVACVAVLAAGAPAPAQQPALEIPVLMPLTGTAAFLGTAQSKSLELLEGYVNDHGGIRGRKLHFAIQDDQSNPQIAVQLTDDLIAHHAAAIIGPAFTAECLAVAPLLKNGPVGYCTSPGIAPPAGSYVYSAGLSGPNLGELLVRYCHGKGWTRIGLITSNDASGQAAEAGIDRAIALPALHDVQVADREHFTTTDLSVVAQMSRIKAANVQAVIEWTAGTAFATLLRGTRDVALGVPVLGSNANMQFQQLDAYKDFTPRELLFPTTAATTASGSPPGPLHDQQQIYFGIFKKAGLKPDAQNNTVWDPALLLLSAFRTLGPDATAQQVQDYLQHLHSFAGTAGIYDFRDGSQRGITIGVGVVARWDPDQQAFIAVSRAGGAPK